MAGYKPCVAVFAPFARVEGPKQALSSYLDATNFEAFANLTDNAFNFWHLVASLHKGSAFRFGDVGYSDVQAAGGAAQLSVPAVAAPT